MSLFHIQMRNFRKCDIGKFRVIQKIHKDSTSSVISTDQVLSREELLKGIQHYVSMIADGSVSSGHFDYRFYLITQSMYDRNNDEFDLF